MRDLTQSSQGCNTGSNPVGSASQFPHADQSVSRSAAPASKTSKDKPKINPVCLVCLPAGEYRTIVADPPWPQRGAGPLRGREGFADALCAASKPMPYPTMSLASIKALRIPAAADAHLYLWTTNRFLEAAFG